MSTTRLGETPGNTPAAASAAVVRNHLLSLRVMRLSKPSFCQVPNMAVDPGDNFASGIQQVVDRVAGYEGSMELPLGFNLMTPQALDTIYLGETFMFYMVVLNESSERATDVSVTVEMQGRTQKKTVLQPMQQHSIDVRELLSSQCTGQVYTHEIKEVDHHILHCSVAYKTAKDEKLVLRKYFKFMVKKPIDVRTKFYNPQTNTTNDFHLEAQIENLCPTSLVLDKVIMDPGEGYTCKEVKPTRGLFNDEVGHISLKPRNVRQYLFRLSPISNEHAIAQSRGVTLVGKLDMQWRTPMGEKGRLQTSNLQRLAPSCGDLKLFIEHMPSTVCLLKPFTVTCRIYNCCDRSLDLVLALDGNVQPDIIFCTTSGQHLGQVAPGKSVPFALQAYATEKGFLSVSGIRVTDTFLRRTYEQDDIAKIFVF